MAHIIAQSGTTSSSIREHIIEHNGIILFDGECAFCEGRVRFIARHDRGRYFRFGASQSPRGAALLASHGYTRASARSIVLIEDGEIYLRSTAVLRIARHLDRPWSWTAPFLAIPAPFRDIPYRIVAAVRTRLAGRANACEIPPPEIRDRLI
jgi:predicted DCC family thiol-disulfide oxidoreductase YuxK